MPRSGGSRRPTRTYSASTSKTRSSPKTGYTDWLGRPISKSQYYALPPGKRGSKPNGG